jgi:hypothetical protein
MKLAVLGILFWKFTAAQTPGTFTPSGQHDSATSEPYRHLASKWQGPDRRRNLDRGVV